MIKVRPWAARCTRPWRHSASRAGHQNARVVEFRDSRGRITTGVRRPSVLSMNVFDVMLAMAGNDVGGVSSG